jgi:hypothetical protein
MKESGGRIRSVLNEGIDQCRFTTKIQSLFDPRRCAPWLTPTTNCAVDWNQAGVIHPARFDKVGEIHGCLADRAFSGN